MPYYAVVGDRERSNEEHGVNSRARDEERSMSLDERRNVVVQETSDLPDRNRTLPKHLSKPPRFVGN